MSGRRRKAVNVAALVGPLALVPAYRGVGYFTGAVPFPAEPHGDITASDLCDVMGSMDDRLTGLDLRRQHPRLETGLGFRIVLQLDADSNSIGPTTNSKP